MGPSDSFGDAVVHSKTSIEEHLNRSQKIVWRRGDDVPRAKVPTTVKAAIKDFDNVDSPPE